MSVVFDAAALLAVGVDETRREDFSPTHAMPTA